MITAGVDIGTRSAKAVILGDGEILASKAGPIDDTVNRISKRILKSTLKMAGISRWKLGGIAATGYGRKAVKSARLKFPDTLCVARGVHHLCPNVQVALDVGGLMTRAIKIGENGAVLDYLLNEKCASGGGRFIEMIADALEVPLSQMGTLSLSSNCPLPLTSQCVVFAESEVIGHVNAGNEPADILAGLHRSIAERIDGLARKIGLYPPVAVVGGVAKNDGVMHYLGKLLGVSIEPLPEDPQMIAALGAALLAGSGGSSQ